LFQFTNPTWQSWGHGSVYDPYANADAGARFTAANIQGLKAAGYEPSAANTYLAHFAGLGGAKSVLAADPRTPVPQVLSAAAVRANPFLRGMRVADLRQWAAAKMGGLLDPAEASVAQYRAPPGASLTASSVGLGPEDRAALAPWYAPTSLPAPVAAPGTAPPLPAPQAVAQAFPGPAGPPGVPVARFDPTYTSPPSTQLNPADRAAVDAMYPPGQVVTAQAPSQVSPAPAAPSAIPPPPFPGAAEPAPTPVQTVPATPETTPQQMIAGAEKDPTVTADDLKKPAAPVDVSEPAQTAEGEGGEAWAGLLGGTLNQDQLSGLSQLGGLLARGGDLPAPPEPGSLIGPGTGVMASPYTQLLKQFRQQKLANDIQKLQQVQIPGAPPQGTV
jgi:hypothetical protein